MNIYTLSLFLSLSLPLSLYALSCTDIFLIPSIYISVSNLTKTYIYIYPTFFQLAALTLESPNAWVPQADGGDQQLFDDGMRELRKAGIQVWPSPDVMVAGFTNLGFGFGWG